MDFDYKNLINRAGRLHVEGQLGVAECGRGAGIVLRSSCRKCAHLWIQAAGAGIRSIESSEMAAGRVRRRQIENDLHRSGLIARNAHRAPYVRIRVEYKFPMTRVPIS